MGSFGSGRPFSSLPRVQMIISCSRLQSLCQANTNTWPLSVRITVLERKNKVTYTVDLDSPICFFFLVMPRAMQDLLQPGIKPMPPALGVWILNLWTPRKVPHLYFKNRLVIANIFFFFFFYCSWELVCLKSFLFQVCEQKYSWIQATERSRDKRR